MIDSKELRCEGYEFNGPELMRNGKGGPMEGYQVRRLADNADLHLTFSSETFRDKNLQVCKAIPSDGWLPREYDGCTFMAVNMTTDDPDTAEELSDPRLWSILWLRDGVPPMKFWPGAFRADSDSDRDTVWTLLMEQVEGGKRRIERSVRDRSGKDTGAVLPEWAERLRVEDITSLTAPE